MAPKCALVGQACVGMLLSQSIGFDSNHKTHKAVVKGTKAFNIAVQNDVLKV